MIDKHYIIIKLFRKNITYFLNFINLISLMKFLSLLRKGINHKYKN